MGDTRSTVLAVPGSLRAASSNRTLLEAAAVLAPPGMIVRLSDHLATLPHFNPDLDGPGRPPEAAGWRAAAGGADGILISIPEYAHGMPGAFKNGLDWLVSDPALVHKPIAIWNASPRGEHARASLVEVLRTMSTRIVEAAGVTLPILDPPLRVATLVQTPELRDMLRRALETFAREIRSPAAG
ncbi:MAG TPA: NADPH-dependent FMN reductase [Gemmatimonadales bacterium]